MSPGVTRLIIGLEAKFYWPRPWVAWPRSRLSGLGLELNEAKAEACEVRGCFTIVLIYILLNSGCDWEFR